MGEFLNDTKIGTCENLYYARLSQLKKQMDSPATARYLDPEKGFRYRFPFPSEDGTAMGDFDPYDYGFNIPVFKNKGIEIAHGNCVTEINPEGAHRINLVTPCPITKEKEELLYVKIRFLKYDTTGKMENKDGLYLVVECPYCGAMSGLTATESLALTESIVKNLDKESKDSEEYKIVMRIIKYCLPVVAEMETVRNQKSETI